MVDTSHRNNERKRAEKNFWSALVVWGIRQFKNSEIFVNEINSARIEFGGSGELKAYQLPHLIAGTRNFLLSLKLAVLVICAKRGWTPQTQQEKNITYSILSKATDDYSLDYYLRTFPSIKLSDTEIAEMEQYYEMNKRKPKEENN